VGRSCIEECGGLAHNQASQKYHDAQRIRHRGLNVSRGQTGKEEEEDDTKEFGKTMTPMG
jgi:hypothetical protein